jgi:aryl-alcohol dehydrogenase-like predicted oxidoreductase
LPADFPDIGPRTQAQLTDALKAAELALSGDTLKKIEDIFPGPGGPAPQAYAW